MSRNSDDIKWVVVYTTNTQLEADMLKANLSGAGVPCEILSQVDSTRMFSVGELAIVKIYVPEEHKEEALDIIKDILKDKAQE